MLLASIRKSKTRTPSRWVCLWTLIAIAGGCSKPTITDIVPVIQNENIPRQEGSVYVGAVVTDSIVSDWVENKTFKAAIEDALIKYGPFSQIKPVGPDYVLDVWMEKIDGVDSVFDDHKIDITSLWRLTRVKDKKVLICDFVQGSGTSYALGLHGNRQAMVAATRETIHHGLLMLADGSATHLSALSTAGLRASMGPVVTKELRQLAIQVSQNWSKLRTGMTVEEVETLLGPIRSTGEQFTKGATHECVTGAYRLVFINDKLSLWEWR